MPRYQAHPFADTGTVAAVDEDGRFGFGSGQFSEAAQAITPISGDGGAGFAFDGQQSLAMVGQ